MNKKFFGVLVIGGLLIASYVQAERKQAAEASDTATKQTVTRKTSVTKTTKAVSKSAQEPAAEAQKAVESTPAEATVAEWTFDPAHSSADFEVRHMMVSTVRGNFTDVTGKVILDEKDLTKSKITAVIAVASINTNNKDRDAHLKSKDFFDAAKYPKMTFVSSHIKPTEKGKYDVTGKLTIRNITRPVVLKVEELTDPVKNPFTQTWSRGIHAKTTINRAAYGMKWNKAIEAGGVVVGDKIDITINAEIQRPRAS